MAGEPELVLLDEPVAGLNIRETEAMGDLILRLKDKGQTIILVEHNMHLVMGISDWLIVLHHGSKIARGPAGRDPEGREGRGSVFGKMKLFHRRERRGRRDEEQRKNFRNLVFRFPANDALMVLNLWPEYSGIDFSAFSVPSVVNIFLNAENKKH